MIIPFQAIMIPLVSIYGGTLNILNHRITLIFMHTGFSMAMSVFMFHGFIKGNVPIALEEAAYIDGCTHIQTFFKIILPQVIKRILPSVTNEVITLVKDTSLSFSLAYAEMFTIAKQIAAAQTNFMPFVVAAVFYYVFNLVVAVVMETIEKKLSYYH